MTSSSNSILKKLLLLFLIIIGLYFGKAFLMPLTIGAVLATLFLPLCNWMEANNVSRGIASTVCLLVILIFISSIGAVLGWQISELTNDIVLIKDRISNMSADVQNYIFKNFDITLEKQWQLLKTQRSSVTGILPLMANSLASIFTNFVLMLVYIFGLLYYRKHIKIFLLKLFSLSQREEMEKVIYSVAQVSQQYLVGLSKMIVCLWIMYSIGFGVIGVKNAIFFAILCGLLEIVPFIGNITGTIITVLVSAVQGASLPMIIGIIGTYGTVQFIQGWVLEPLIVGSQVKINPLFTIIALVIGELIWGIPGIFLAIPLIAMFKIVSDHVEQLKPYGFLIGEVDPKKAKRSLLKKVNYWFKKIR